MQEYQCSPQQDLSPGAWWIKLTNYVGCINFYSSAVDNVSNIKILYLEKNYFKRMYWMNDLKRWLFISVSKIAINKYTVEASKTLSLDMCTYHKGLGLIQATFSLFAVTQAFTVLT